MFIDRKEFYERYRASYGKISTGQLRGIESIFDFWDSRSVLVDRRWLAYILATAFHETGRRMQPVREGFCPDDPCSIRAVQRLFRQGKISVDYSKPHSNGKSYFGRGLVQLTWGANYKKSGRMIGIGNKLYDSPSLLLRMDVSVKVLCVGMLVGSFTGVRLEHCFNSTNTDWKKARRIINGTDRWRLIAEYGQAFRGMIEYEGDPDREAADAESLVDAYTQRLKPDDEAVLSAPFEELLEGVEEINDENVYLEEDTPLAERAGNPVGANLADDDERIRVLTYEEWLELPGADLPIEQNAE